MKKILILSTLAVVSIISTGSFAQTGPTTFGNSSAIISAPVPAPSVSTFIAPDQAYVPRQLRHRHLRGASNR